MFGVILSAVEGCDRSVDRALTFPLAVGLGGQQKATDHGGSISYALPGVRDARQNPSRR